MSNTTDNRYGSIAAEIYDIDKPYGALPDTAFYIEALADVRGPILEPACGSGRAMIPLLRAGHEMAGFEPSKEMLDRCRARAKAEGFTPDLREARYEDFDFGRTFAAIIVPVGSFTLIDDFSVAMDVLARFHRALAPGGRLIIDQQTLGMLPARGSEDTRSWTAENGDLLTIQSVRTETDYLRQRIGYRLRYERWRDNKLVAAELEPMVQRFWGVDEFALALKSVGFGEISVVGNYSRGRSLRANDRTLTFDAVKS